MTETNVTSAVTEFHVEAGEESDYVMMILHSTTASVGIIANLTVVVAFLNHKKFRRKIPNIFIINQVRLFLFHRLKYGYRKNTYQLLVHSDYLELFPMGLLYI